MMQVLAFHIPYLDEWGVILVIGLLLFGKRLPEVGRNLGKGIVEFKKGIKGVEDDVETATSGSAVPVKPQTVPTTNRKFDSDSGQPLAPQLENPVPAGAKFDPYTGKPLMADAVTAPVGET